MITINKNTITASKELKDAYLKMLGYYFTGKFEVSLINHLNIDEVVENDYDKVALRLISELVINDLPILQNVEEVLLLVAFELE